MISVEHLSIEFSSRPILDDITFLINPRDRIALVGKNGAGKTTLLRLLAGAETPSSGRISKMGDITIGYLPQVMMHVDGKTLREDVMSIMRREGDEAKGDEARFIAEMDRTIIGLGFERKDFDRPCSEFSGGWRMRIELAKILLQHPDLLLLDEPTNHLDIEMVEWLEDYLSRMACSLLMVTHDRYFLDNVCNEIVEIDDRQVYRYKGNYSYFLQRREERLQNLAAETARARNLLRTELDWMRRQPQARAHKAKYRIDAFYKLEEKAALMRDDSKVSLEIKSQYIGNKIFVMKALSKAFGEKIITKDFYYTFARYEKLGIVGNNGTGKSTFIKMLLGKVKPDSGVVEVGETVKWGYYSQDGLAFNEEMKVIDVVKNIAEVIPVAGKMLTASQFLQHFLFSPEKQYSYVYKLSGGEKRRLYLCTVLMSNPNFLVLDEPTNDLDIETLQILEEYLRDFKGCVIVVSHDRYFMDKVVDHVFVFNGNGDIKDFPGNYTEYRDWREEEKALAAKETEKSTATKQVYRTETKRKLTFKERKEYESLEEEIMLLEEEKNVIEQEMCSGVLDNDTLLKKSMRIQEVIELIDTKTTRWIELSEFA